MESSRCSALFVAAEFSFGCIVASLKLEVPVMPSPVSSGSGF